MKVIVTQQTVCSLLDFDYGPDPCSVSCEARLYESFIKPGRYTATREKHPEGLYRQDELLVIRTVETTGMDVGMRRIFVFTDEQLQVARRPAAGPPSIIIEN